MRIAIPLAVAVAALAAFSRHPIEHTDTFVDALIKGRLSGSPR
jgi:hypothetical protein